MWENGYKIWLVNKGKPLGPRVHLSMWLSLSRVSQRLRQQDRWQGEPSTYSVPMACPLLCQSHAPSPFISDSFISRLWFLGLGTCLVFSFKKCPNPHLKRMLGIVAHTFNTSLLYTVNWKGGMFKHQGLDSGDTIGILSVETMMWHVHCTAHGATACK